MNRVERIGHIVVPADDLDAMAGFYGDVLGLSARFRDGDRYLAVTDGSVTLGLAGAEEQPVPGAVTISLEVVDLAALLEAVRELGHRVGEVVEGAHERRAVVQDPSGTWLCVYERLAV